MIYHKVLLSSSESCKSCTVNRKMLVGSLKEYVTVVDLDVKQPCTPSRGRGVDITRQQTLVGEEFTT